MPLCTTIIGGGFSGLVLALHLARSAPASMRVRLIERGPDVGPGLAYGVDHPDLRLNVPAARMSAFPDRPLDFLDWLTARARAEGRPEPDGGTFATRHSYGLYLRSLLDDMIAGDDAGRVSVMRAEVTAIDETTEGCRLHLADGGILDSDHVVIATGNNPPTQLAGLDASANSLPLYANDPWAEQAIKGLASDAPLLLVGTGLTMVDVALRLLRAGHRGQIHAVSRRGLVPLAHGPAPTVPSAVLDTETPLSLLRQLREQVRSMDMHEGAWRAVVDSLRPVTQALWQSWSAAERRQFLTHLRPWWDIHRHRMPTDIGRDIASARSTGQLQVRAGRIRRVTRSGTMAEVQWQPRGSSVPETLHVARVINCTGPATEIVRAADPLTRSILATGLGRPGPQGLGLDVTPDGALLGRSGVASARVFGLGPICRNTLWEITAVPDIRRQCQDMARWIIDLGHDEGLVAGPREDARPHATAVP